LAAARDAQGEQAPGWPVEDSAPVTLQQSDTGWVLTRHRAARVKALATCPDLPVVVAETLPDTGPAPRVLGLVLPADGTQSAARGFL
ncbi:hypothetical protein JI667_22190, partial [Bacillus sp. NTK074B]|nr:hypothetical protein [Bacillus sp. NTK074B]